MNESALRSGMDVDLIVVGGGLAGLATAAMAARAGKSVVVLEKAGRLGGRAVTDERDGALFNLGPHALYCHGRLFQLLHKLEVPFSGRFPVQEGARLFLGDAPHPIPTGVGSLLTSRLLSLREKWRLSRFFQTLDRIHAKEFDRTPLADWIQSIAGEGNLALLLRTFARLNTFTDSSRRISAGAVIRQMQIGFAGNVWYLDGGWNSMVEGLRNYASAHGVVIRSASRVESIQSDARAVALKLASGESLHSRAAVLAVGPEVACELLELPAQSPLREWVKGIEKVQVSCLDVALSGLSQPDRLFSLGVDRPLYYSVHSATAKLAPEGIAVVQVMKYLGDSPHDAPKVVEAELEAFLEQQQPDWRGRLISRRYLPAMLAASCLPTAKGGGLGGRPMTTATQKPGVFLAGDWVGDEGMLSDASAASAEQAAAAAIDWIDAAPLRHERSLAHA